MFYYGGSEDHFEEPHFIIQACFLCRKPLGHNRDIFMYSFMKAGDTPTCKKPGGNVFQKISESPSYDNATYELDSSYGYILTKPLQQSPQQPHHKAYKGKQLPKWGIALLAVGLFMTCALILFLALKKQIYEPKGKKTKRKQIEKEMLDLAGHGIQVFNYSSVLAATANFSLENKIGEGGYGPVYKDILSTGQEIVVKRLSNRSKQGIVEFNNEIILISGLQHKNLVHLLGCCIEEEEKILIYEYMTNKSLDFYLFGHSTELIDWKNRFNIINGISHGLVYLHKHSRLKIVHRDLKAGNILLDENMNPKISDFGMAKMFSQYESRAHTAKIAGTHDYMPPEYLVRGAFSTKLDVFSFGVLILEIVSGRRCTSFCNPENSITLIKYAWELWRDGVCLQLIYYTLIAPSKWENQPLEFGMFIRPIIKWHVYY